MPAPSNPSSDRSSTHSIDRDSSHRLSHGADVSTGVDQTIESHYPCHGVHASLPRGKASGQLTINRNQLLLRVADQTVRLNIDGLQLSLGGASDRLVFFSHPAQPDWRFYTSERSVLKDPNLKQQPQLQAIMARARRKRGGHWLLLAAVVLVCLAAPLAVLVNMDVASRILAERVPLEWEQKLGKLSFDQYRLQAEIMAEEESELLLQPLVTPLLEVLPNKRFDYRFYINNSSELNAFALPGGVVVINAGLILAADSAEEVLGVVGHEISHVRQRHGIRNLISSAGSYLLISALLGDVSGITALLVDAAPLLINQGYSRQFESEADNRGFDMLVAASIDPAGLARFFEKLIAKERQMLEQVEDEQSREWLQAGLGFLSSHPATQDRIGDLNSRLVQTGGDYRDLSEAFTQLRQRVSVFVAEPEGSTAKN